MLPPIQTFGNTPNSTNSVQHRFEGAERLPDLGKKVDISDMTWEQKEQVRASVIHRPSLAVASSYSAVVVLNVRPCAQLTLSSIYVLAWCCRCCDFYSPR